MQSISVYNLKGGVGKTTTTVNLAYLASQQNNNTLLWDWDPQAASTWYFNSHHTKKSIRLLSKSTPVGELEIQTPFPKLTLIPADLSLRKADATLQLANNPRRLMSNLINPLSENARYLFNDCPPSLSPSVEYVLACSDLILVPIIPSPMSVRAIQQVVDFFKGKKHQAKHIVGFFNQVDMRRKIHRETLSNTQDIPIPMLKTWIPYDSAVEKMSEYGSPLTSRKPSGRAYDAYQNLWKDVKKALKKA